MNKILSVLLLCFLSVNCFAQLNYRKAADAGVDQVARSTGTDLYDKYYIQNILNSKVSQDTSTLQININAIWASTPTFGSAGGGGDQLYPTTSNVLMNGYSINDASSGTFTNIVTSSRAYVQHRVVIGTDSYNNHSFILKSSGDKKNQVLSIRTRDYGAYSGVAFEHFGTDYGAFFLNPGNGTVQINYNGYGAAAGYAADLMLYDGLNVRQIEFKTAANYSYFNTGMLLGFGTIYPKFQLDMASSTIRLAGTGSKIMGDANTYIVNISTIMGVTGGIGHQNYTLNQLEVQVTPADKVGYSYWCTDDNDMYISTAVNTRGAVIGLYGRKGPNNP